MDVELDSPADIAAAWRQSFLEHRSGRISTDEHVANTRRYLDEAHERGLSDRVYEEMRKLAVQMP